ncbi:protein FAR1-RELATED SEQUENCE 5-like [Lotus japonicus]|uniref:protein FAR1-RELATED SEQUENCE 5-like n=1 Tax=Lotus japonicus TaxID=34305 RepID=UPI00258AFC83|nr:protein FAR1-RELATED SEQUENCE 5-like [Lotus japonicus]
MQGKDDELKYFGEDDELKYVSEDDELKYFGEDDELKDESGAGYTVDEQWCDSNDETTKGNDATDSIPIDCVGDICSIDLKTFLPQQISVYDFVNLDVAYLFYVHYGRANGFCVRKYNVIKSLKTGDILQQDFVCNRNGRREVRGLLVEQRKREPKRETRCGCKAKFRVHVDIISGRWYCTCFTDNHNHELFDDVECGMQAPHRKMNLSDIAQMNSYRDVGIGVPHIFRAIANQCGGVDKMPYSKRSMYNQISRQRRMLRNDSVTAMQFLAKLDSKDDNFYCEHIVDQDNRLQHLFWSDGIGRLSYQVYGDVLAFDATYGKNKYLLPIVVFSGVNNHNRTTIFAIAVVTNETEETYVWLLEQFLAAMNGKQPVAVITDGHPSMRNAIRKVFPNAYHRLCAWHLLQNANRNIGNPLFTQGFKNCMFGDYDVGKFKRKWDELVLKLGLVDNSWVQDTYEKRKMWASAHLRGKFFGGFRTTSRCEGFHSELGKYVHSRQNLTDFLQQLTTCVKHMRYRELDDDCRSIHGVPVPQTKLKSLEMSAAKYFTENVFRLFRPVLHHAPLLKIVECKDALTCSIYTVAKPSFGAKEWHVSFYPDSKDLKCSCMKMESRGLPCEHIVAVLAHLKKEDFPESIILKRWTKGARDGLYSGKDFLNNGWNSLKSSRCGALMDLNRVLADLNSDNMADFNDARGKANELIQQSKAKKSCQREGGVSLSQSDLLNLKDPLHLSRKGRGGKNKSCSGLKAKRTINCSICKEAG